MGLKRDLGTIDVFALASGAMISSGIFILPAFAWREAGSGVVFAYALAGLAMLPAVLAKMELASAIPKAGGAYFYLTRVFGVPVGIVAGLADWFAIALKSAFALVGIGVFALLLFPGADELAMKGAAVGSCAFFALLNLRSARSSGSAQLLMVAALLAIMIGFVFVGWPRVDFSRLSTGPAWDLSALISTTAMVLISFGGITKTATMIEEVRDPSRSIVRGLVAAFSVVFVLYILIVLVVSLAIPEALLGVSASPLTDAVRLWFSPYGSGASGAAVGVMAIGGLLAFLTTANAGIMSASRVPMAMARDGLLPSFLGRLSRRDVPAAAIGVTSLLMTLIILALEIESLAKVASIFLMLVFAFENMALILLRRSRIANYRPAFRAPFFPWLQIGGVLFYAVLIVAEGWFPIAVAVAFIALALLWYALIGRHRLGAANEIISLARRLVAPETVSDGPVLEEELLEILMERDRIVEDAFDAMVRAAPALVLDRTVERDELFTLAAAAMAESAGKPELSRSWMRALFDREALASTIIFPGVAVPHAFPPSAEPGSIRLALVRAPFGCHWGDEVVYSVFCILAAPDARERHLKGLMSIAQTLQDPGFLSAWNGARDALALRSAVLLAKRRRHGGV